jgi:hypothetical protein
MVGLNQNTVEKPFEFYLTCLLMLINGIFIGLTTGAMFSKILITCVMIVIFTLPLAMFAGFFGNKEDYLPGFGLIQYISPFKYCYEGNNIFLKP